MCSLNHHCIFRANQDDVFRGSPSHFSPWLCAKIRRRGDWSARVCDRIDGQALARFQAFELLIVSHASGTPPDADQPAARPGSMSRSGRKGFFPSSVLLLDDTVVRQQVIKLKVPACWAYEGFYALDFGRRCVGDFDATTFVQGSPRAIAVGTQAAHDGAHNAAEVWAPDTTKRGQLTVGGKQNTSDHACTASSRRRTMDPPKRLAGRPRPLLYWKAPAARRGRGRVFALHSAPS